MGPSGRSNAPNIHSHHDHLHSARPAFGRNTCGRGAAMRVLYLNHTGQMSGAERSLLELLAGLPPSVSPILGCPDGDLAMAARDIGVPVTTLRGTSGSLRIHPRHTTRAFKD